MKYSKNPQSRHSDDDFSYESLFGDQPEREISPREQAEIDAILAGIDAVVAEASSLDNPPLPVNDDEIDWSNKVTDPSLQRVSNQVTKRRFRRSDSIDKVVLNSLKLGNSIMLSGVDTVSNSQATSTPTNDNKLPHWCHTGDRLKLSVANRVVAAIGHSFSLNLDPNRLKEALNAPGGFSDCLARYINRALKRKLGRVPLFWFQVDVTKRGKLHLHGAIESTADDLPRIMEALNEVGGRDWKPARPGEKQCWFDVQHNPDGWVRYSLRRRARVRFHLKGGRSHFIAKQLRALASETYGDLRRVN